MLLEWKLMRVQDIDLLRCIDCNNLDNLELMQQHQIGEEIISGLLRCKSCNAIYPILNSTGVFFRRSEWQEYLTSSELATLIRLGFSKYFQENDLPGSGRKSLQAQVADNWEFQWREVYAWSKSDLDSGSIFNEKTFWEFIPLEPESIIGKVVYVACGGRGREAYHLAKHRPSLIIVAEIGAEVYDIYNLGIDERVPLMLLRCDVSSCPLREAVVDVSICDHALQHVKYYAYGYSELVKATKVGGKVGICVYSHENNFLMTKLIEPLKKIIHKFPLKTIRIISLAPAIVIYFIIHLIYIPFNKISPFADKALPLNAHMLFWRNNSLQIVWLSCFDLIHAPISYHFRKCEVRKLAKENMCEINQIILTHGTTWSLICTKLPNVRG
ncbi:MAG: methyltransferase domain-containing protein [Pseudomonadota bacterium]